MKQYIGISRDHSASMRRLTTGAMADYNTNIDVIRTESINHEIDTIVSVVENGVGLGTVRRAIVNSSVNALKPMTSYVADGRRTPLFDSIGELIEMFSQMPDKDDPNVSFLIMVITDGGENNSTKWPASRLVEEIRRLQMTDQWTFTFRVPKGYGRELVRLFKIPEGNVIEWDQSERGIKQSTAQTTSGISTYYKNRSKGVRSTSTFYADMSGVSSADVQTQLSDITPLVTAFDIRDRDSQVIRDFVESKKLQYIKGTAYYQLTKSEPVQSYKDIIIFDRQSGSYFNGDNARRLLGLPQYQDIRLRPSMTDRYIIFIQSTSVNRKLVVGTQLLILRQ